MQILPDENARPENWSELNVLKHKADKELVPLIEALKKKAELQWKKKSQQKIAINAQVKKFQKKLNATIKEIQQRLKDWDYRGGDPTNLPHDFMNKWWSVAITVKGTVEPITLETVSKHHGYEQYRGQWGNRRKDDWEQSQLLKVICMKKCKEGEELKCEACAVMGRWYHSFELKEVPKPNNGITLDHAMAKADFKGNLEAANNVANLQLYCFCCNSHKSNGKAIQFEKDLKDIKIANEKLNMKYEEKRKRNYQEKVELAKMSIEAAKFKTLKIASRGVQQELLEVKERRKEKEREEMKKNAKNSSRKQTTYRFKLQPRLLPKSQT